MQCSERVWKVLAAGSYSRALLYPVGLLLYLSPLLGHSGNSDSLQIAIKDSAEISSGPERLAGKL